MAKPEIKKQEKKSVGLGIKVPKGAFKKGQEAYAQGDEYDRLELEPGKYTAIIVDGRGVDTQNGPQIVLDIKVPEAGKGKLGQFYSLEEERIKYLFRDLSKLGYEVEDLDEAKLTEMLADIKKSKPVVRISAKQQGEYVNVRIDKLLPDLSAAEVEGGETSGEQEETKNEDEAEETPEADAEGEEVAPKASSSGKAGGKTPLKVGKGSDKAGSKADSDGEEEPEEDGETPEDAEQDLEGLSRSKLKKIIAEKGLEVKVVKSMSDDDVREAVKAALAGGEEKEEEAEEPEAEEPEAEEEKPKAKKAKEPEPEPAAEDEVVLKKGMKVNATIAGKLVKGCVVLETLEDEGKVRLKTPDAKIFKLDLEKLSL